jgi:hypothetical protein
MQRIKIAYFSYHFLYNHSSRNAIFCFDERWIFVMTTSSHINLEPDPLQEINALAKEIDCPVEEVNDIYVSALRSLKSSARIQDYLHVLASKKVRDLLRH